MLQTPQIQKYICYLIDFFIGTLDQVKYIHNRIGSMSSPLILCLGFNVNIFSARSIALQGQDENFSWKDCRTC